MASLANRAQIHFKHQALTGAQITLLCLFAWGCQILAVQIHSPIPGSVIGLGILLLLLASKLLPESSINLGSSWLIGDLLLFFIPPVVAVIKYQDLLEHYGAVLIGSMLIASSCVLLGTAFTVDRLFKFERKQRLRKHLASSKAQVIPLHPVAQNHDERKAA
ncbi:CidA/LrgA family protein [Shewanella schlegeliana]|uniref:CidA/LrgA family protein n=1 Tax=Shewanella schlegeliana TaxID=190308 RepID=A0ABS1SWB0_9GAMM|nr:CidA/LrgA family protein [Shewanella schlegeliana]MBL4912320.1 CidA/LrgA family protein [Shewanella schlegeliana]MCL1108211.1 CidA/LrgA family protein [Shewanella schlegeliana]GIU22205.1 protein LrgA [Shewanella schlegeliana]